MIINYKIPFSKYRKVARTFCKIFQFIWTPFANRKILRHLNGSKIDYRDIPVIIINFNRISYLVKLLNWLENAGMRNIYIIDNASSNPLVLDYYEQTKHNVIKLNVNLGYKVFWDTPIHLWFKGLPYILTDPDVLPEENCPLDAVQFLQEVLNKYSDINKVGFGLQIDDIPDFYYKKAEVIEWETKFWMNPISENLYKADIDTTFALYRANSVKQQWGKTLRTGGNYLIKHLPWYENSNFLSEEELYYGKMMIGSSWCAKQQLV